MTRQRMAIAESSPTELALLRSLLDLALQPIDEFAGFSKIEQIGLSAYRYQLNFICYALAMSQYTRTPAFTGYLTEAQANTIIKMTDRRVWRYWATERLLGYGRWDPDPMAFGNVMYTGYFATMLAMFERLNDDRFSRPGSLPLIWSAKKTYLYDFGRIAAAIARNMQRSKWTLYPCEPHLVYPFCNNMAMSGLTAYDRLHGTDLAVGLLDRLRDSLHTNKFLTTSGVYISARGPFGFRLGTSVLNDATAGFWAAPILPDLASITWNNIRTHRITLNGRRFDFAERKFTDTFDFTDYSRSSAMSLASTMLIAAEMGDHEVVEAIGDRITNEFATEETPSGSRRFSRMSLWAFASYVFACMTRPQAVHDLFTQGLADSSRNGPILGAAAYPDVLVARAVSGGDDLKLVLLPGSNSAGATSSIRIERLVPGRTYCVAGAFPTIVTAPANGVVLLDVRLRGREEVNIRPADVSSACAQ